MDADDLERLLGGLGTTLANGIGTALQTAATAADARAAADRAAADERAAADRAALVAGLRSGGRTDRGDKSDKKSYEKEDLAASIIKTQSHTVDWLKDNTFNPEEIQIGVWKDDVKHKLRSKQCGEVIEYAGHKCYIRRSNDLHFHLMKYEQEYRERVGLVPNPANDDDAVDRTRMYYNGKVQLQGRDIVAWRKLLVRQSLGYLYTYVSLNYEFDIIEMACYKSGPLVLTNGATIDGYALVEHSSWFQSLSLLVEFAMDHQYFDGIGRRSSLAEKRKDALSKYMDRRTNHRDRFTVGPGGVDTPLEDLWKEFHAANPNVPLPVEFVTHYEQTMYSDASYVWWIRTS